MDSILPIPSVKALQGINNLFDSYASLRDGDIVIVCFWHEYTLLIAWLLLALEDRRLSYFTLPFASREEHNFQHELFTIVQRARVQLKPSNKIVIFVCDEEALSFSSFLREQNRQDDIYVWRMMNTSIHLFEQAFATKVSELKNINGYLLSRLSTGKEKKLRITNDHGTDLSVTLNNEKYSWISTYGKQKKNELIILPTGEVNTFPEKISGTFTAFGAVHSNIKLPFDARLEKKPITLKIIDGVLESFFCLDQAVTDYLNRLFNEPHMVTVGEFGIGTNIGITDFVPNNSHINERFPGVHLGLGAHFQKEKLGYKTRLHMDFISPYGEIYINDDPNPIQLDQLTKFSELKTLHPDNISAEDGD